MEGHVGYALHTTSPNPLIVWVALLYRRYQATNSGLLQNKSPLIGNVEINRSARSKCTRASLVLHASRSATSARSISAKRVLQGEHKSIRIFPLLWSWSRDNRTERSASATPHPMHSPRCSFINRLRISSV